MLYIVPTPIGNLEDLTFRAVRILKEVDLILAEDTRVSKILLNHYQISTPLKAHHIYNEHEQLKEVLVLLRQGKNLALISDAGTPGIADPGFLLIREVVKEGLEFEVLPGACALITAVVASGLPTSAFIFEGFLPHKKGKQTQILAWKNEERTVIFYESVHRILKTLELLNTLLGSERKIVLAKEITKKFQGFYRGTLGDIHTFLDEKNTKGEWTVILEGIQAKKNQNFGSDLEIK